MVLQESISQLNITSNIDDPESVLDALLQATVCGEVNAAILLICSVLLILIL